MISFLRVQRRKIALIWLAVISLQLLLPSYTYALTSGPTQPEAQAFQAAGTSDMVDLFSGDFSYNIPLFELPGPNGGYPFNLAYQSGITMDQEASWVGLGWSLNPGAINRQMRGFPDEFNGDVVYTKSSIADNVTVGAGAGASLEIFGASDEIKKEASAAAAGAGENSDSKATPISPSINVGFGVYYNNYKGMGYSIDASLGFKKTLENGMTSQMGLDVSVDADDGVSASPSLSLGGKLGNFGVHAAYNSHAGLSSISMDHSYNLRTKVKINSEGKMETTAITARGYSSIGLAHPGYTPQISMPMRGTNISGQFKVGGEFWGVFGSPYIKGYYSEQKLLHDRKRVATRAFGFMHYQDASGDDAVLDVNREKEGMVSKFSPNLPIPIQTYDIYSVSGQGISAMYRPMRNEYGVTFDNVVTSTSISASGGVDVGIAVKGGVNLSVNHGESVSRPWRKDNDVLSKLELQRDYANKVSEPWYFKVHGESAGEPLDKLAKIGGDKPVRVRLDKHKAKAEWESDDVVSSTLEMTENKVLNDDRKVRTQVIQPITNEQLLKENQAILAQFNVRYIDEKGVEKQFERQDRAKYPAHHPAGFTALTPDGLRYVYGIPAYNRVHEEVSFSARSTGDAKQADIRVEDADQKDPVYDIKNTDQFLKKVEIPPYAHAYLLTSIVGADYVDVKQDGVTDDDLGYWVKFTYQKTTPDNDLFKWRDPFNQAHFQPGWKSDPRDDKGSYTYGEKEIWFLSRAETKSHIAVFKTSPREDAYGAKQRLQKNPLVGSAQMMKLDRIELYTRLGGPSRLIKAVVFNYGYSICPGVDNREVQGGGKLTLKGLAFQYGSSSRGSLNPYVFAYSPVNPGYDPHAYDRWGNYKPYPEGDPTYNDDFPYVAQDPEKKDLLDQNASAWNLSEIMLPSGGRIRVDYEIDDYAYVQDRQAMQMMQLVDPYKNSTEVSDQSNTYWLLDHDTKIRFKLERTIKKSDVVNPRQEVLKYLDPMRSDLYFKIRVELRDGLYEDIAGYVDVDLNGDMGLEENSQGDYAYGFFYLKKDPSKRDKRRHPFSLRAWQHIRTNQPELISKTIIHGKIDTKKEILAIIKSLANGAMIDQIRQTFQGFNAFCDSRKWGRSVKESKSWIRLNSPDKIKYGGGLRVRQITLQDALATNNDGIYGQVYEYTTNENGKVISSGVASYEPQVGGDENPMRYAKKYHQAVPLRSDNNMYFEYPINETYYPGPQVGYAKVTVTSLASAHLAGKGVKHLTSGAKSILPTKATGVSYGTTGMTVHEFYTAKDFPVVTDETSKVNKVTKLPILVPFLGNLVFNNLTSSQGYSIITNDMHGKQKRVSNYRQDKNGNIEPEPISWVKYNYAVEPEQMIDGRKVTQLHNKFKLYADGSMGLIPYPDLKSFGGAQFTIGQESEFFTDMREFRDATWEGGARLNLDIVIAIFVNFGIPSTWPSIGATRSELRMASTNKVIFKKGILESTEAFDGGSLVRTSNLRWDPVTGGVVLTQVNNNFDKPIYSYTIPAYSKYLGMGPAYQNTGLVFDLKLTRKDPYRKHYVEFVTDYDVPVLPGDEYILYDTGKGSLSSPIAKAVFVEENENVRMLYIEGDIPLTSYRCLIVRSGFRNQLGVQAGSISALKDPTINIAEKVFLKTVKGSL